MKIRDLEYANPSNFYFVDYFWGFKHIFFNINQKIGNKFFQLASFSQQ